ncbi:diacylglycerol kinase, partial [Pantoea agglomerans]|uniref:diacylglycerol kinase n=1 Tax=Enterobacter agglomerans TaxID=549 RepID=UPI0030CA482C
MPSTTKITSSTSPMELLAALAAIVIACWLDVDVVARILMIGAVVLVVIVEILNSAI